MPSELTYQYSSVKVRTRDYDAARQVTQTVPIAIVDVFTAWRILWESVTEKERFAAILKVRQQEPAAPAQAV